MHVSKGKKKSLQIVLEAGLELIYQLPRAGLQALWLKHPTPAPMVSFNTCFQYIFSISDPISTQLKSWLLEFWVGEAAYTSLNQILIPSSFMLFLISSESKRLAWFQSRQTCSLQHCFVSLCLCQLIYAKWYGFVFICVPLGTSQVGWWCCAYPWSLAQDVSSVVICCQHLHVCPGSHLKFSCLSVP